MGVSIDINNYAVTGTVPTASIDSSTLHILLALKQFCSHGLGPVRLLMRLSKCLHKVYQLLDALYRH